MMKKVWLVLLAVVLVFGLVVSCGGSDGPAAEKVPEQEAEDDTSITLPAFDLLIKKNQYSPGNQENITFKELNEKNINTKAPELAVPVKDETYTLTFECTPDKNGTQKDGVALSVALVDSSQDSDGPSSYWFVRGDWNAEVIGDNSNYANIEEVIKDTKITFTGTVTINAPSAKTGAVAGTKAEEFCLSFAMVGQDQDDEVTLSFTKFTFKKN